MIFMEASVVVTGIECNLSREPFMAYKVIHTDIKSLSMTNEFDVSSEKETFVPDIFGDQMIMLRKGKADSEWNE